MLRERDVSQSGGLPENNGAASLVSETSGESTFDHSQAMPLSDDAEPRKPEVVIDETASSDIIADVEKERGTKGTPGRGRRRFLGAVVFLGIAVAAFLSFWFVSGSATTKKARVPVNNKSAGASDSEEAMTREALKVVNAEGPGVALGDGTMVRPQPSPGVVTEQSVRPATSNTSVTDLPGSTSPLSTTVDSERTATNNAASNETSNQSTIAKALSLGRNNERSVRIGEESVAALAAPRRGDESDRIGRNERVAVALPSFGSMLPVKSLGVIYSLRSGGLAQFELTRDVKGKGWFLPHGTVLVGALRGAEYDRAFISLVGFIDNDSGKLVRVGGDVLGPDGGSGVRGKNRNMSSGWSKALRKLGEAGLNIAGAAAGSIGRRPVIITDAYGQLGARFGDQFDGALFNKNRDSFVEVPAGTSCYVMIADLPERIQGVDALAKLSRAEVEEKSDVDQRREATGISEHELAELIQSGDASRIKAALPRMTAEMRRVAEAVIADCGDE